MKISNFVNNPKLLEDAEYAALSTCAFFEKTGCLVKADADDIEGVISIVNKYDNKTGKQNRRDYLILIKQKLGE